MNMSEYWSQFEGAIPISMIEPSAIRRLPFRNEISGLEFGQNIKIDEDPNGGGWTVKVNAAEISYLNIEERQRLVDEFLKIAFSENEDGRAHFVMGIVQNEGCVIPCPLDYLTELKPSMRIKVGTLAHSWDITGMPIKEYRNQVYNNYTHGIFRAGPMFETSLTGVKREETGGYFPEILNLLEGSDFLRKAMPWSTLSTCEGMDHQESNDGPIVWIRPGEQTVALTENNSKRQRLASTDDSYESSTSNSSSNPAKRPRQRYRYREARELLFEDRTKAHADFVKQNGIKMPTAAVGVIKAVHCGKKSYSPNRRCKEVVAFSAQSYKLAVEELQMNVFLPPTAQCMQWIEDAKLNSLRAGGMQYSKITLNDNDAYFIPRNVVHQFRTLSACSSYAWHLRLKKYDEIPMPVLQPQTAFSGLAHLITSSEAEFKVDKQSFGCLNDIGRYLGCHALLTFHADDISSVDSDDSKLVSQAAIDDIVANLVEETLALEVLWKRGTVVEDSVPEGLIVPEESGSQGRQDVSGETQCSLENTSSRHARKTKKKNKEKHREKKPHRVKDERERSLLGAPIAVEESPKKSSRSSHRLRSSFTHEPDETKDGVMQNKTKIRLSTDPSSNLLFQNPTKHIQEARSSSFVQSPVFGFKLPGSDYPKPTVSLPRIPKLTKPSTSSFSTAATPDEKDKAASSSKVKRAFSSTDPASNRQHTSTESSTKKVSFSITNPTGMSSQDEGRRRSHNLGSHSATVFEQSRSSTTSTERRRPTRRESNARRDYKRRDANVRASSSSTDVAVSKKNTTTEEPSLVPFYDPAFPALRISVPSTILKTSSQRLIGAKEPLHVLPPIPMPPRQKSSTSVSQRNIEPPSGSSSLVNEIISRMNTLKTDTPKSKF